MIVLGIESSCDELSMAIVEDGYRLVAMSTYSQIDHHSAYNGVVPELAGRLHAEALLEVYRDTIRQAGGVIPEGVAVTNRPGLAGSLLVGLSFAKGLAWAKGWPLVGVDHLLAHLYAPRLEGWREYPFLGLLVSGGHTLLVRMDEPFSYTLLGTTVDDAVGEVFDKVAKYLGLGYPGGPAIERLAQGGNPYAYHFPKVKVEKGRNACDMSFSGIKTAVLYQKEKFQDKKVQTPTHADLAASFQRTVVENVIERVDRAVALTGIRKVVVGGGVAANSWLRSEVAKRQGLEWVFPALKFCCDNGAMVAALGWEYLSRGEDHGFGLQVSSRSVRGRKEQESTRTFSYHEPLSFPLLVP